jgi:bifunctional non-homologous end joining protein LigD
VRHVRTVVQPLVEPIVPLIYPQPFDSPEWLFEPKYDGFRGLLYLSGRECRFRFKRGDVLRRFEQLCYWVREELVEREVILDGEVIALDHVGRQDFRLLMRGEATCTTPSSTCSGSKGKTSAIVPSHGGSGSSASW